MKNVLLVGVGGFFGSVARYGAGVMVARLVAPPAFPFATLLVNFAGCFLIGFIGTVLEAKQTAHTSDLRLFLLVGLLGGFTTFSAFGYETMKLMRDGAVTTTFVNVAAHVILGLGAVWCGMLLAKLA